jgi:hypothetical protein
VSGRTDRRSATFRIARNLKATFSFDAARRSLDCDWHPEPPRELRGAARRNYNRARSAFLASIAPHFDRQLLIIETFDLSAKQVADLSLALATPAGHA